MAQARKTPEPGVEVVVFAAEAIFLGSVEAVLGEWKGRKQGKRGQWLICRHAQVACLIMPPVGRACGLEVEQEAGTEAEPNMMVVFTLGARAGRLARHQTEYRRQQRQIS